MSKTAVKNQQKTVSRIEKITLRKKTIVEETVKKQKIVQLIAKYRYLAMLAAISMVGILAILLISSQSTKKSYILENKTEYNNKMALELDKINKDIADSTSPAEIAIKANEKGMVYKDNPKRLIVNKNGKVTVFSTTGDAPTVSVPLNNPVKVEKKLANSGSEIESATSLPAEKVVQNEVNPPVKVDKPDTSTALPSEKIVEVKIN